MAEARGTTAGRVLVGGEALIDLVVDADGHIVPHAGGGPFNAARTLGRLGVDVAYLGALSDDRFGRLLGDALVADRVSIDHVLHTALPTTLALAELDAAGSATYRFYAEGTAAPALTEAHARAVADEEVAALHVGSLGLLLEPVADALELLVGTVGGRALVFVDPNCRPTLVHDKPSYLTRLGRVLRSASVVKASEDDLAFMRPGVPAETAARELLEDGPRLVLVTLGAEGALAVGDGWTIEAHPPPVTVVDTVGAGDSFGGGWLAWWLANDMPAGALGDRDAVTAATRFACRVAAITCSRAGASPPWRGEDGLDPASG